MRYIKAPNPSFEPHNSRGNLKLRKAASPTTSDDGSSIASNQTGAQQKGEDADTDNRTGPYGELSRGKKMGANDWINLLKEKYLNKEDHKLFAEAEENQRKQLAQFTQDPAPPSDAPRTHPTTSTQVAQQTHHSFSNQAQIKKASLRYSVAADFVETTEVNLSALKDFQEKDVKAVNGDTRSHSSGSMDLPADTSWELSSSHTVGLSGVVSGMEGLALGASNSTPEQETASADVHHEAMERHQPPPVPPPSAADLTRPPNIVSLDTTISKKLQGMNELKLGMKFPKRQLFTNAHTKVYTNHFEVDIPSNLVLHKYTILPGFPGLGKRKVKDIVKSAIRNSPFLASNVANFATNYFDTIIAWADLHSQIPPDRNERPTANVGVGSSWRLPSLQDGRTLRQMSIRYDGTVDIANFLAYSNADSNVVNHNLEPTKTALNMIISKCFDESPAPVQPQGQAPPNAQAPVRTNTFQVAANKFYLKNSYRPLVPPGPNQQQSHSLETSRGFEYQMRPGVGKVLLNLQTRTSATYRPVLLSELMRDNRSFAHNNWISILKGLWVRIEYDRGDRNDATTYALVNSEQSRVKTIESLGNAVSTQSFILNGQNTTVEQYLTNTYGLQLHYPQLEAVNLGSRHEPSWFAPEHLRVMPFQLHRDVISPRFTAAMMSTACVRPYHNAALIEISGMETLGYPRAVNGFQPLPLCPVISVHSSMMKVPAQVLSFPHARYGARHQSKNGQDDVFQLAARWNTKNRQFLRRNWQNLRVTLLVDSRIQNQNVADNGFGQFQGFAGRPHGQFTNYSVANVTLASRYVLNPTNRTVMGQSMRAANNDTDLFLLVLANKDYDAYSIFKDLADRQFGKHSMCITAGNLQGHVGEKMGNLMLKANLKTRGINHSIANGLVQNIFNNTLVLGADVTHPGPSSITGCPSIAAIVGSVDGLAGRFLGSMRLQARGKKEMIDELEPMVKERIQDWVKEQRQSNTNQGYNLPKNILYYRDGVSDEQFEQVKTEELPNIRRAFLAVVEELRREKLLSEDDTPRLPKITAIVCVKRHNVRFYPSEGEQDRNDNCRPGTLVDNIVTSPFYMDFYLQSHAAIKGTAKPAHYFVIENEMGMSEQNIRQLTHELCYTYARSTTPVSYASPAYYADRLCERGRQYLRDFFVSTAAGRNRRDNLDKAKNAEQDRLRGLRIQRFGPERLANGTKRAVGAVEQAQRQNDKSSLTNFCERWTMNEAAIALYGSDPNNPGPNTPRNPWDGHANLSRTMFWM